jgi:hypothetical protein
MVAVSFVNPGAYSDVAVPRQVVPSPVALAGTADRIPVAHANTNAPKMPTARFRIRDDMIFPHSRMNQKK